MPLNTYNDAVGPIAKSVRELALVLDAVTGSDAEDEATADADRHIDGLVRCRRLDTGALKGARDRRDASALRRRHRRARSRGARWNG